VHVHASAPIGASTANSARTTRGVSRAEAQPHAIANAIKHRFIAAPRGERDPDTEIRRGVIDHESLWSKSTRRDQRATMRHPAMDTVDGTRSTHETSANAPIGPRRGVHPFGWHRC